MDFSESAKDYQKIEAAIYFTGSNFSTRPGLDEIADHIGLSESHFIELVKRWAGVTPDQLWRFLTPEYCKRQLTTSRNLLESTPVVELSEPTCRHDLSIAFTAIPSEEYKKKREEVIVEYGYAATPFGQGLLATTEQGINFLGFVDNHQHSKSLEQLQAIWPGVSLRKNEPHIKKIVGDIFSPSQKRSSAPLHLHLKGTDFQIRVWQALLRIPAGHLACYQDIAKLIDQPNACRAVARAIARNPVACVIPCHRIITKAGKIHNYRWNPARKKTLLAHEAATVNRNSGVNRKRDQ